MKKSTLISATLVTALSAFAFAPATFATMGGNVVEKSPAKEVTKTAVVKEASEKNHGSRIMEHKKHKKEIKHYKKNHSKDTNEAN